MAYLDLDSLVLATVALIALFFIAGRAFSGKPRRKESGRVEVVLEVADYLCRGYPRGFVDR